MVKMLLQKAEEFLLNLGALFFLCTVVAVFVCFIVYPAFSCTFVLMIALTTISIVHWGYCPVDFPGTAVVPYWGLATGLYLTSFVGLHYLNRKGDTAFDVGWLSLGVTALIAIFVTFIVCLAINYPRR